MANVSKQRPHAHPLVRPVVSVLGLARQSKVGELILGALCFRSSEPNGFQGCQIVQEIWLNLATLSASSASRTLIQTSMLILSQKLSVF